MLGRLGLVDGLAAVVVGVTLTACEGDCAGTELVEVLAHAACGDDGVVEDGVDVAAGLVVVTVVVVTLVVASVEALVVVPEVVSAVGEPPDVEVGPTDETGAEVAGELDGSVALGSRLATLALS